jgi:hypothetical protein
MKWITIKLMKFQLKVVSKQQTKLDNSIVSQAYENMIKTYKDAIMYLEVHNKNKLYIIYIVSSFFIHVL